MCVQFLAEAGVALIFIMCKMALLVIVCCLTGQRSALCIGLISRMHITVVYSLYVIMVWYREYFLLPDCPL